MLPHSRQREREGGLARKRLPSQMSQEAVLLQWRSQCAPAFLLPALQDAFYEFRLVAFAGSYISNPSNTVNVSTTGKTPGVMEPAVWELAPFHKPLNGPLGSLLACCSGCTI